MGILSVQPDLFCCALARQGWSQLTRNTLMWIQQVFLVLSCQRVRYTDVDTASVPCFILSESQIHWCGYSKCCSVLSWQRWLQSTKLHRRLVGTAGFATILYRALHMLVGAVGVAFQHKAARVWRGGKIISHQEIHEMHQITVGCKYARVYVCVCVCLFVCVCVCCFARWNVLFSLINFLL